MSEKREYKKGIQAAIFSAALWGILPIYWQALRPIDSVIIIFYRIFLVGFVCLILSIKLYGIEEVKKPLKNKGLVGKNIIAGLIITSNWSIYIWAVNADFVIQTCIGYYIEPLMVCIFGVVFFKEKLETHKIIALVAAVIGILLILIYFRQVPFIALGIAFSFAMYAAIKKTNKLPALISLFYETVFLMPIALAVIVYIETHDLGALGKGEPYQYVLLLFCGVLTATPLGLFAIAAQKVPLTTMGILEYISPSLSLILGIFLMKEPFDLVQFISFVIIWIGLIFFTRGEMKKDKKKDNSVLFENFEGNDRFDFPDGIVRVTAGTGGEAILIKNCRKSALMDCGMAYCGKEMVENIKKHLGDRQLDYVFISHTHYDHIGALPYVKKEWPDAKVVGSAKAKSIFERPGAVKIINELGKAAQKDYSTSKEEMLTKGFNVDIVVSEGDEISLGEQKVYTIEAKGHTDCSLCYVLEPMGLMFASESTGHIGENHTVCSAILKSYKQSIETAYKCKEYGADRIISPHFGIIPKYFNDTYFDLFVQGAEEERKLVKELYEKGMSDEEILEKYKERYWNEARSTEQPEEAFMINARYIIKTLKES